MNNARISKSVLFSWAISYLLVFTIPVLIFFYGSLVTRKLLRQEISTSNKMILDNISQNIDEQMVSLYSAFHATFTNNNFIKLSSMSHQDSSFYQSAYSLQQGLQNYSKAYDDVGILIYFHKWNYISSSNNSNDVVPLYELARSTGLTYTSAEWIDFLSDEYQYYFISNNLSLSKRDDQLIYGHTVTLSGEKITLFTFLPVVEISDKFKSLDESILLLLDDSGDLIYSFGNENYFQHIDLEHDLTDHIIDSRGNSFVVNIQRSSLSDWSFSLLTPEKNYWTSLNYVNNLYIGSIFAMLVLSVTVSVLLLHKNYQPLKSIKTMLGNTNSLYNEYDLISTAYKKLSTENRSIKDKLEKQSVHLRERYLLSKLKGRSSSIASADMNTYFQLDNKDQVFCLVLLTIEMNLDRDDNENNEITLFAINNVFSETIEDYLFYKLEDGHELLYLLSLDQQDLKLWQDNQMNIMNFMTSFFNDHLSVTLSGVVSEIIDEFDQIDSLYSAVMNAYEYKTIVGQQGIIFPDEYNELIPSENLSQLEQIFKQLSIKVSQGNYDKCKADLDSIFSHWDSEKISFASSRIVINNGMYQILNDFNNIVLDLESQAKLSNLTVDLMDKNSKEEIYDQCLLILDYACKTIKLTQQKITDPIIKRSIDYIESNYTDMNLNINQIAEHVSKNPSYLSQLYFQHTGIGLLDTIHNVRIDHAKNLLKQTSMTIEEIALEVGFSHSRTFRRVFVKLTDMKPTEYRTTYYE